MELLFNDKEVKVYSFDSSGGELEEEKIVASLKRFPILMQERIGVYKASTDRNNKVIGKLLLEQLLKDFDLEKKLNLRQIHYSKSNQPFFDSDLFFSIAHSGNKVICAASKTKKVGVDIEAVVPRDVNEFIDILSDKELLCIQKNSDPLKEFYKFWTKKEALSKAMGEGVNSSFMKRVSFEKEISITENEILIKGKKYFFYELPVSGEYMAMLVVTAV